MCLETIKQGFEVKIVVFYKKYHELVNLVKILSKILPRTVKAESHIEFYQVAEIGNDLFSKNFLFVEVLSKIATREKILNVSLPISPLNFPSSLIMKLQPRLFELGLMPYIPLSGISSEIFGNVKEIGLEKHISKIEKILQAKITDKHKKKVSVKIINDILKNKKDVTVRLCPNIVHEILDSLEVEH